MYKEVLCDTSSLDIIKTFECGQCFRWNREADGTYYGVVNGIAAKVWNENDKVYISATQDYDWLDYFDLGHDYHKISNSFMINQYMRECVDYGFGIRILRQESWEALCSFIISQCNNIPRIKGIVEKLCTSFGDPISFEGKEFYSFPSFETINQIDIDELSILRCGYRAPYIKNAAKCLSEGTVDLEALKNVDSFSAYTKLLSLEGVGPKVANCVNLFGLYHLDAFPIDVWMKRAISEHFDKNFNPSVFGEYAGLAQQYMFYHARAEINEK